MNEKELQRYKKQLIEMRDRSRDEVNRMIEVVLEDGEASGEHDRRVSESVEKEIVLQHTEEVMHNAILDALRRVDDGTFGKCQQCGARIPKARLEIIPFTPYCVKCEQQREEENGND